MNKLIKLDWVMLVPVFLLLFLGLIALWSVSFQDATLDPGNLEKQIVSAIIGLVLMLFFAFYDYRVLSSYSTKLYFAIVFLLFLVIIFGTTVRGHTGWIGVGSFRFQPVEIAKLILIIFLASFFSKKKNQLSIVMRIIASIMLVSIPLFLVLKQPDIGSSVLIVGIWAIMLSVSGISKKNLAVLLLLGMVACSSTWFVLKNYQKERIINFIDPNNDPQGSGYNVIQSMVAVGSGKMVGKGLGQGTQSQLDFLPEKHTDFIFAVIAEELGFFGGALVLALFGVIFWRIKEVARTSRDNFGYLLSVGIVVMIFLQALVNIGMNIGMMPVTGVPLPLLSYGGSSLVITLASIGIVQSVFLRREKTN